MAIGNVAPAMVRDCAVCGGEATNLIQIPGDWSVEIGKRHDGLRPPGSGMFEVHLCAEHAMEYERLRERYHSSGEVEESKDEITDRAVELFLDAPANAIEPADLY